jgi:hypothetical protein
MTDCGEDVGRVCGCSLDAVAMVYSSFAGFVINIEILQIVVKVDGTGAEVSSEERGMGCEDGCDVDAAFSAEGESDTSKPFVEMGNDSSLGLVGNKL